MRIDPHLRAKLKKFVVKKIREEGEERLIVTTPFKMSSEQLRTFTHTVAPDQKLDEVENRIDTSLIGGFILQKGSKRLDASISGSINSILSQLTHVSQ